MTVARNELTDELSEHGVKGVGFAQCTNATRLRTNWQQLTPEVSRERKRSCSESA